MSNIISETDPSEVEGISGIDINQFEETKAWLVSQFDAADKDVPDFEHIPQSISYLHNLATVSRANTQAALIVANDLHHKATEYRSEAARIKEILKNVGLTEESLPKNVVSPAQVVANVANLLNTRDTELSSFLVAMGNLTSRKTEIEERRTRAKRESKFLLNLVRTAISRLGYLKRTLQQLEQNVLLGDAQMEKWKMKLEIMAAKEKQYTLQLANFKKLLNDEGYTPEISHWTLVEMAEHKKQLEEKTAPVVVTLRSYLDLPPDKALAVLAIEDKKKEYAAAEKYLEDVLQSALATTE